MPLTKNQEWHRMKEKGLKFNCKECKNSYVLKSCLVRHVKSVHKGERKIECNKCGKSLKRGGLRRHQELHTMNEEGLKFHCKECNGKYTCRSNFSRHLRTVHANKTIEPVIILEELRDLPNNQVSNTSQKSKVHEDQKPKTKQCKDLPKPKKGMWIVKLKRLERTDLMSNN